MVFASSLGLKKSVIIYRDAMYIVMGFFVLYSRKIRRCVW